MSSMRTVTPFGSFERAGGQTSDEKSLEDQEEDYHGDDHDQAPRSDELILLRPAARKQIKTRGEHLVLRTWEVEQRLDKGVPGLEEDQHCQDRHARPRQ